MRLGLLTLLLWACGSSPTTGQADAPVGHADVPRGPPPTDKGSLYDLGWTLEGAHGDLRLDATRGHPTLVSMFYTSCPMACPLLIERIHGIERSLSPAAQADVRVLLVSLDPANDTRAVLARTYEERALDPARWTLARVGEESVRELAAVLGIPYRRAADGGFNHASVVVLLDRQGRMVGRLDGMQQPTDDVVASIEAMQGAAR